MSLKEFKKNTLCIAYVYQFGCGILNMVGPKKQDFWPKINILKRKPLYFENTGSASSSKIGHKVVQKLKLKKKYFYKIWSP